MADRSAMVSAGPPPSRVDWPWPSTEEVGTGRAFEHKSGIGFEGVSSDLCTTQTQFFLNRESGQHGWRPVDAAFQSDVAADAVVKGLALGAPVAESFKIRPERSVRPEMHPLFGFVCAVGPDVDVQAVHSMGFSLSLLLLRCGGLVPITPGIRSGPTCTQTPGKDAWIDATDRGESECAVVSDVVDDEPHFVHVGTQHDSGTGNVRP